MNAKRLSLLFIFSTSLVVYAQSKIVLREGKEEYKIGRSILVYKDDSRALTIDRITSGVYDNKFFKPDKDILNFGVSEATFWIKIVIVDSSFSSQDWYIKLDYPIMEQVIFYKKTKTEFLRNQSGARFPFAEREFKIPTIIFRIPINYGEENIYYLQICGGTSKVIPLQIITAQEFVNSEVPKSFFKGGFYGILAIMIFYNFFLFLSVKDKTYLYYVFYVISYSFYQFSFEGYSFQYFWEIPTTITWILTLASISFISITWLLLSRAFLQTQKYIPKIDVLLKMLIVYLLGVLLLSFFQSVHTNNILAVINIMTVIVVGFIVAIIAYRKENKSALYYLLAVSGTLAGIFIRGLRVFGYLNESFFTQNVVQYGILWEVSILSFALGNRINTIKAEKEKEKAIIRSNIAADLHDEIGSNLSSISILGQLAYQKISNDDEIKSLLEKISTAARESSASIRDIGWFINSTNDTSENLVTRIIECSSKLLSGMNSEIQIPKDIFEFVHDLKTRRHIFLIIKEAITNVAKHSSANFVEIIGFRKNLQLHFIIRDNGKGFDEKLIKEGNGLRNIKNRAIQINALLTIEKMTDKNGTVVTLSLNV